MTTAALSPSRAVELKPLKPMALTESILLFGIPGAILAASLWWMRPALTQAGVPDFISYTFSLTIVNVGLLVAAVVGYVREGNPLTWSAFSQRMRLAHLTGRIWLWTIAGTLLFGGLALVIEPLATAFYRSIGYEIPIYSVPEATTVFGGIVSHIIVLFFNIVGEELWWRGYILPRQELTHGKITWLIHGILWACFHMFKWWAVPFMLITCLIIPFVAQKTRNTWPGMINHIIINGAGAIMAAM
jgi:membrane protease YdiL (CAAX protease family)